MLEFYFLYRGVLRRLRGGALGAEMDRIAEDLSSLGYKRASAKIYLSRIARFSHFAAVHCGSEPIGQAIVDRYPHTFKTDSPRIAVVSALQHARRVAPERFALANRRAHQPNRGRSPDYHHREGVTRAPSPVVAAEILTDLGTGRQVAELRVVRDRIKSYSAAELDNRIAQYPIARDRIARDRLESRSCLCCGREYRAA